MSLKVLTVDDSKTIRMIVKKAFKSFDCEIVEAENGQEGLDAAGREKPDLIILDITMPVMTGVEMLEKLKSDAGLKNIPVIMLTAESGKDNVMQIVKMGVQNYMVKPFKGEQLIERVRSVVELKEKPEDAQEGGSSDRHFRLEEDIHILTLPDKITRPAIVEIESVLKSTVEKMTKAGMNKMILDLSAAGETNVSLIKLIILVVETSQTHSIHLRVVGTAALAGELKGFQETSDIPLRQSVEEAKSSFKK